MYKVQLNTSVPYNYSFYCPVSNIMLDTVINVAFVDELTPSIKRGIQMNTLLFENLNRNVDEVKDKIEKKMHEEAMIPKEVIGTEEETKEEVEAAVEDVVLKKEEVAEEPKEEKPKKKKTSKKK